MRALLHRRELGKLQSGAVSRARGTGRLAGHALPWIALVLLSVFRHCLGSGCEKGQFMDTNNGCTDCPTGHYQDEEGYVSSLGFVVLPCNAMLD